MGVVSQAVKRFNDYYFQVDVNFCVNRHITLRIVVFVGVIRTNPLCSESFDLVTADNKLEGGC